MRDFNFFESYINVSVKPNRSKYLWLIVVILIFGGMGYYQLFLMRAIAMTNSEIDAIEAYLKAPETLSQVKTVDEKIEAETALQSVYQMLQSSTEMVEQKHALDDMLIEVINAQVPEDTFLMDLSLTENRLSLGGYTTQYDLVAQLAFNLRQLSQFSNVLIPVISEIDGQYQFTITAEWVKEGHQ